MATSGQKTWPPHPSSGSLLSLASTSPRRAVPSQPPLCGQRVSLIKDLLPVHEMFKHHILPVKSEAEASTLQERIFQALYRSKHWNKINMTSDGCESKFGPGKRSQGAGRAAGPRALPIACRENPWASPPPPLFRPQPGIPGALRVSVRARGSVETGTELEETKPAMGLITH